MIISLTTDFGYDDPYVGMMKAIILGLNPEACLVDLSHGIAAHNVEAASLLLAAVCPYFPQDAVHLAVVDPGVGSERRCLAARTGRAFFVAPDNGLLTAAFAQDPPQEVVALTERRYWRPTVSPTFHGRDIMAPVAAHLSLGVPLNALGPRVEDWVTLSLPSPRRLADGSLQGHVVHIDRFGNLITDLKTTDLPVGDAIPLFEVRGEHVVGLSRYYAEREGLLALEGSMGYIEIALNGGSAAARLGAKYGDEVVVRCA